MENFELVDDYLANRLNEPDKIAFEQKLEGDPSLKKEVEFQRQIVQGVRHARTMQLKTMLNNVPVGGSVWTAGKLATAVVSVGVVATFMYVYLKNDDPTTSNTTAPLTEEIVSAADAIKEPSIQEPIAETSEIVKDSGSTIVVESVKDQDKKKKKVTIDEEKVSTPVHKPDIQVVDPSDELSSSDEIKESESSATRGKISASKMDVITSSADKKHTFHYQFSQGKLMLFGPFDKSLYEILEIHGGDHAVFLFYKENYYLLDESQSTITELQPIREALLLKKLREYHARN